MKNYPKLFFLAIVLVFVSCSGGEDEIQFDPEILVESNLIHTWSKGDINGFMSRSGLDIPLDKIAYDVEIYDIAYLTTYKDETVTASGRIFVPKTTEIISTACFGHGTIASDAEAPTGLRVGSGQTLLLCGLASFGMLVVSPDLIGFGESSEYFQPYFIKEVTATASIDNLYAAKILAEEENVRMDNELYLLGYSQGGHTTMSTHEFIHKQGIQFYDLKASFPAAGGYNVKGVQDFIFGLETYRQPHFMALATVSYFSYYDWQGQYSYDTLFNEPYASILEEIVDGSLDGEEANDQLNDTLAVLVNADYLVNFEDPKYDFIISAYRENSPTGWVPSVPVYMYHGDADELVPFQNSVEVFQEFEDNGAETVSFTNVSGGTHGTALGPYLEDFIDKLIELEE